MGFLGRKQQALCREMVVKICMVVAGCQAAVLVALHWPSDMVALPAIFDDIQRRLLLELQSNTNGGLTTTWAIVFRHGISLFFRNARLLCIIICLNQFSPFLMAFMPVWVEDLGEQIMAAISSDESDPPELERCIDEEEEAAMAAAAANQEVLRVKRHPSGGDRNNSNKDLQAAADGDLWYVFDPVYGVVPLVCRDLWSRQSREMQLKRELAIADSRGRSKTLPPVRNSSNFENSCLEKNILPTTPADNGRVSLLGQEED